MQYAAFNAICPFEIGDKVMTIDVATEEEQTQGLVFKQGKEHIITDIACIHYLNTAKVEFRYELDNNGKYVKI